MDHRHPDRMSSLAALPDAPDRLLHNITCSLSDGSMASCSAARNRGCTENAKNRPAKQTGLSIWRSSSKMPDRLCIPRLYTDQFADHKRNQTRFVCDGNIARARAALAIGYWRSGGDGAT